MNCDYCLTTHRKFYCTDCIKEKLQKHNEQIGFLIAEKDAAVIKANRFLEKATSIQSLIAEKNHKALRLETIRENQLTLTNECNKKRQLIKELERQVKEKQRLLEDSKKRASFDSYIDTSSVLKAWQRTHKMTVGTRRILVKEVTSLFELKPGVVEESQALQSPLAPQSSVELPPFSQPTVMPMEGKDDLYICGVTLPTRLIDVSKYPKEELNAPIGLVIHMLGLVVRYLGIKLPFMIFQKGIQHYIRMIPPNTQIWSSTRKFPLFLEEDDKNFKRFVVGMAMLNYNLAYLCHTQGVKIPVSQVVNTLQSLMACCRAPGLGIQSHALYYQGLRDLDFPIDFQQVLRATTLRYRCSSLQHAFLSDTTIKTQVGDAYFKVRPQQKYEEEYEGLYLDSDDEDDVMVHYQHQSEPERKDSEKEHANQNETWSLVEVAPFLGGRTAHNGNEGESLFQMGAASIMPGVLNMMESLGNNTTQPSNNSPSSLERYWFPRKKK